MNTPFPDATLRGHQRDSTHLSDANIDDYLIGDLAPEPAAHLAACDSCQSRVALAESPIFAFKNVTLSWSERRSATLPSSLPSTQSARWIGRTAYAAAAAVIVAAVAITAALHHSQSTQTTASTHTPSIAASAQTPVVIAEAATQTPTVHPANSHRAVSDDQIAHDNEILQNINSELDASVESPNEVFGLVPVSAHPSSHGIYPTTHNWD